MSSIAEHPQSGPPTNRFSCRVVVIWIDWYPYHIARFRGLLETPEFAGQVRGIELVGGVGVHAGLKFREPLAEDLPVLTLEPQSDWQSTSKLGLSLRLWRALSSSDPDVVLVPGYYTLPGIAAALWARLHGRCSVLMTESTEEDHARNGFRETAKSWLIRTLFDWAVCGGTAHRRYLGRLGFPADRIAGFYDVVDNDGVARAAANAADRAQSEGVPSAPFFLYVGRLAPEKNILGLVRAWSRYREGGGTWSLVLAGDGPERAALDALLATSPFGGDVTVTGLLPARELGPFYAHAGCFVLPSLREPWGLVVNEAMAASLPVLVSGRCGAAADLVSEGENGYTFDPPSPDGSEKPSAQGRRSLASLFTFIASLAPDDRLRMGEASHARIQAFSPAAFGREIAQIFRESST